VKQDTLLDGSLQFACRTVAALPGCFSAAVYFFLDSLFVVTTMAIQRWRDTTMAMRREGFHL
jgi:hypothetical protein